MRYYFDTEFIEAPCTIDLISIGILAEDGREFYAINSRCDLSRASDWVIENVLKKIRFYDADHGCWRLDIPADGQKGI